MAIRVGVNALYLIPGGVGGTEIYLRNLLSALAQIDTTNEYAILTNHETTDLTPAAPNFTRSSVARSSSGCSSGWRGSMTVSCGTTAFPATTRAAASRSSAPPSVAPRAGVESGSPASGSKTLHDLEQEDLLARTFS